MTTISWVDDQSSSSTSTTPSSSPSPDSVVSFTDRRATTEDHHPGTTMSSDDNNVNSCQEQPSHCHSQEGVRSEVGSNTMVFTTDDDQCDSKNGTTSAQDAAPSKEKGDKDKETRQAFPIKVYEMLEDAEDKGFAYIVSWNTMGDGFMVHERDAFIRDIVPNYFNQTRYKSFQRQLSLYGFQRVTVGPQKGLRFHEKLRRGERELVKTMKPVGYKPRGPPAPLAVTGMVMGHVSHHHQQQQQPQQQQLVEEGPAQDHQESDASFVLGLPMIASTSSIPTVVSSNSLDKQQQEQSQFPTSFAETQSCDGTDNYQQGQHQHVSGTTETSHEHVQVATSQLSATYREAQINASNDPLNVANFEGNSFYIMSSQQGAVSAGLDRSGNLCQTKSETEVHVPTATSSSSLQGLIASREADTNTGHLQSDLQKAFEIGFRHAKKQLQKDGADSHGANHQTCPQPVAHAYVVAPSPNFLPTVSPAGQLKAAFSTTESAPVCPQLNLDECVDALDFYAILTTQE